MQQNAPLIQNVSRKPTLPGQSELVRGARWGTSVQFFCFLGTIAGLGLGCGAPKLETENCEFTCSDGRCPAGMECRDDAYCVEPKWKGSCTVGGSTMGGGSSRGGNSSTQGGSSKSNQIATTAGAGGMSPVELGSGGLTGQATGTGGYGGQTASSQGGSSGGIATELGGAGASQGGTGGSGAFAGRSTVAGSGGCAGQGGVDGTITIDPTPLKSGCLGEQYSAELVAVGLTPDAVEWTANAPPELGLALVGNKMVGVLQKTGTSAIVATARLKVNPCVAATASISITVEGESVLACPTIRIVGRAPSTALAPASCRAWPYAVQFEVRGGTSPLGSWQGLDTPAGLLFDQTSQKVTGTATASGNIVVAVTDGANRTVQKTYPVPLREKCWFAYLSGETPINRLHLFDPLLEHRTQRSATADVSVEDYQFSPDGKFIAYRVQPAGSTSGPYRLRLWQAPEWEREHELDFGVGASVTHYAWSNDSSVLAVAYTTSDGMALLGGVNVKDVPTAKSSTVSGIQALDMLAPVAAPVQSEITWYGNDGYVAFRQEVPSTSPIRQWLWHAPLLPEESRFSAPSRLDTIQYNDSLDLFSGPAGFFAVESTNPTLTYYGVGITTPILHGNVVVAPSGSYTAAAKAGRLDVYHAFDSSLGSAPAAPIVADGCNDILTWSRNLERVACVDARAKGVNVLTLNASGTALQPMSIADSKDFVDENWADHRRLFSSSGTWLALVTDQFIRVASLGENKPRIAWLTPFEATPGRIDLGFSPDEKALILQNETSLYFSVIDSTGEDWIDLGSTIAGAEACQESPLSVRSWCGRENAERQFVWSSDSELAAFNSESGALRVLDLRNIRLQEYRSFEATAACVRSCAARFQFQP